MNSFSTAAACSADGRILQLGTRKIQRSYSFEQYLMESDIFNRLQTLSQLGVTDSERTALQQSLESIIKFIDIIHAVDTEGIEPLTHPVDVHRTLRSDEANADIDRSLNQSSAPETQDGFYLVPRVVT